MNHIYKETYDLERSLYNLKDTVIDSCSFMGPRDGESVLKECRNIIVNNSSFSLRYPLWHAQKFEVHNSSFDSKSRAPLWYCSSGVVEHSTIRSVKAIRECVDINIINSDIISPEFGWKNKTLKIINSKIESEYCLFESKDMEIIHLDMKGKYSFQYVENVVIRDSNLGT